MKGRHMRDTPLGQLPPGRRAGDYWRVLHPKSGDPIRPEDGFWGSELDHRGNLTGGVWGFMSPDGGGFGVLVIHTVREEEDGTISVRPGDGSTNSVLHQGHRYDEGEWKKSTWHGYVEHGDWVRC